MINSEDTTQLISLSRDCEFISVPYGEKEILKEEHDKQIAENMKKLHDGTYKPRPWAGFPWNREE